MRLPIACFACVAIFTGCNASKSPPAGGDEVASEETNNHGSATIQPSSTQTSSTGEFENQFAKVSAGDSDRILLRTDPITTEQLSQLGDSASLLDLLIDAGGPTDADMQTIAGLHLLEHLRIRQSQLTDRGIELLCSGGLQELAILNLPQARITAAGIRQLQSLPSLTNLRLGGKQIDDLAVAEIAKLPKLRSLHLISPSITGASLRSLAEAPKLTSFYLDDCDLPDEAWNALFEAKPNLHVHVDQQHHDRDPGKHAH